MEKPDILLTIDYGQVCAEGEVRADKYSASLLSLRHETILAPLRKLGAGDMTGLSHFKDEGPPEHWPYRNQMLITLAAMRYQRENLTQIVIGTVKSDNIHSDGTSQFISAMEQALIAQNSNLKLSAPAHDMTSEELARVSGISADLMRWTFSCHRANVACGGCRGCSKTLEILNKLESPQ